MPDRSLCGLDGPQSLGGGEACGSQGGDEPGDPADDERRGDAAGPGFDGDDGGPMLGVGVDGRGGGAEHGADDAAEPAGQNGFREELDADMAFGGAQGAPQSDLRAALEDGDDHDVGDSDCADQEGDGAEAEEQAVEGALGVGLGDEGGGGLADVHLVGALGVRGGG